MIKIKFSYTTKEELDQFLNCLKERYAVTTCRLSDRGKYKRAYIELDYKQSEEI